MVTLYLAVVNRRILREKVDIMQTILLVEEKHLPIPPTLKERFSYGDGSLTVKDVDGKTTHEVKGKSLIIEGDPEDFEEWLRNVDGIWTTLDPSAGDWSFLSVDRK